MALLPEEFNTARDNRDDWLDALHCEAHRRSRSAIRYSWWAIGISLCTLVFSLVVAFMN